MKETFKKIIFTLITWQARFVLLTRKPKIIAVTGSVGKTTAKDAIFSGLQSSVSIRKSQKSFNSDIGVPLTILGLPTAWSNPLHWIVTVLRGFLVMVSPRKYPQLLVLETGIDRPGDMEKLTTWLKPDVAVFTAFPSTPVHVEFFPTPEDVWNEKLKLAKGLTKDGVIVANADDANVMKKIKDFKRRVYTFGHIEDADVRALVHEYVYEEEKLKGITFKIQHANTTLPVNMSGVVGKQHVYPALVAIACGVSLGLNPVTVVDALRAHVPPRGRMNILPGINESTLIDDTYNSSPIASEAAIDTLAKIKGKRKIAILGDMLELGSVSKISHEVVGEQIAMEKIDVLITVGVRAKAIAESASKCGMDAEQVYSYPKSNDPKFVEMLQDLVRSGDVVLIKGSQGSRMERATKALLSSEIDASEVLVRQEDVWDVK